MKKSDLSFMQKFKPEVNTVKEFKYWIVTIREKQVTLGDCIFIPKRKVYSLADLSTDESKEFAKVVSWYEQRMRTLFEAEKFNYFVAMMKDDFVHYHAFPRYSHTKNYFGCEWIDEDWPKIALFKNITIDRAIIEKIIIEIKED